MEDYFDSLASVVSGCLMPGERFTATFDAEDRLVAVCDDGGQASSRPGDRLGGVRYLLSAIGAPGNPQLWTAARGRQLALWNVLWRGPYQYTSGFNVSAAWRTLGSGPDVALARWRSSSEGVVVRVPRPWRRLSA